MADSKDGPFAILFLWVGLITGGIGGAEAGGAGWLIGAIVLGVIGYAIGKLTDAVVAYALFIAACLITALFNAALRALLFAAVRGLLSSNTAEAALSYQ